MRKGITILSDIVMIVALLMIISGLWIYTANYFKQRHLLEAASAEEAIQVAELYRTVLSDPGMCTSMSISLPRGVRIYIATSNQTITTTLVIIRPAGAKLDLPGLANMLVTLGERRSDVKLVYYNGKLDSVAIMINGTVVRGLEPIDITINGKIIELEGVNWTSNTNMIYFNYKDTMVKACSRWDNEHQMVVLVVPLAP